MNTEASHGTADSSGEILCRDIALLDIFSDENQNCHNLREMNTSITRCINILQTEVQTETQPLAVTSKLIEAVGALLRGEELWDAEKLLVADMDAIPKEIRQKIKKGVLRIAESKQIDGDVRAAIVDSKNKIVKQITLKQGTGKVLSAADLNMLAVQAALRDITERLECIDAGVQYLITLKRRGDFQTPFFDAMNKVIEAKNARNVYAVENAQPNRLS